MFGAVPTTVVVGGSGAASATGGGSSNLLQYSSQTPAVCSVNQVTGIVTGKAAGQCTIAADQTGDANYNAATEVTKNITVGKGSQVISFGIVPSVIVGGNGTVAATGGVSGNPVTFSSTTTGVCTVSGSTVTGVSAGSCSISADQSGNVDYNAAPQATQSFEVVIGPKLTIVNDYATGGTIFSDSVGIACGQTCTANFATGKPVKLIAIPAIGYQFSGWGGACSGYANYCTLTMDAA